MAQPLEMFDARPVVLDVPYHSYLKPEDGGMAAGAFSRCAEALRVQGGGSILGALFKRYLAGYEPKSVTLVGFSAGGVFLSKVLKTSDATWVDGVVALDAVHLNLDWQKRPIAQDLDPWANFGIKAARDERLMVLAHTHISPLSSRVSGTRDSSRYITDAVFEAAGQTARETQVPLDWSLLASGPPPPAVTLKAGPSGQVHTRTYDTNAIASVDQIGNFWTLDYQGTGPADHVYVAWYGQRDVWRCFLAPRMNAGASCRYDLAGLGSSGECMPTRVTIPPGTFETSSLWMPILAAAGGLGVGTGLGYWFGRKLGA